MKVNIYVVQIIVAKYFYSINSQNISMWISRKFKWRSYSQYQEEVVGDLREREILGK